MTTLELNEIKTFISARIKESMFPEEKAALHKGLKLMGMSLRKFLQIQMEEYDDEQFNSEEIPDLDILGLPNSAIARKFESMGNLTKTEERIMDDFAAVHFSLSVIMFEYFCKHQGKEAALEYGRFLIRSINRAKMRFGEDAPEYVERFLTNMSTEVKFLEEELKRQQSKSLDIMSREDILRLQDSLHYLINSKNGDSNGGIQKMVHPIHFEDYSGIQFERLVYAYILTTKNWSSTPEWLGQSGSDSGRDIWAEFEALTYCYVCANYKTPNFKKAKSDIDKLQRENYLPSILVVIFAGSVSANLRARIKSYAKKFGVTRTEVWSGAEFEEKLRKETPELIKRFVEGEEFPY